MADSLVRVGANERLSKATTDSALAALALRGLLVFGFELHALRVLHAARRLPRRRVDRHLALNGLRAELLERVLDVHVVLRGGLVENHVPVLLAELPRLDRRHFPLLLQIYFVSDH